MADAAVTAEGYNPYTDPFYTGPDPNDPNYAPHGASDLPWTTPNGTAVFPNTPGDMSGGVTTVPDDGSPITPEQQMLIDKWIADTAERNRLLSNPSSATGTAPDTGDGGNIPDTTPPDLPDLPPTQPPPQPPARPADVTGFTPGPRNFSRGGSEFDQGNANQSFASLIPRVAGNASPGNVNGQSPNVPMWARGLSRSPYARFAQGGQQGNFAGMQGFAPEVAPVDQDELLRQQQAMPAWMAPGI